MAFVDIAGLVRGASKGEGLGNQFLASIREVDAILHVLRCFDDDNVTHVNGRINPVGDSTTINTELMLADLASLERQIEGATKRARGGDTEAIAQLKLMERTLAVLQAGRPARELEVSAEEKWPMQKLHLLTSKPVLYVCNLDEA